MSVGDREEHDLAVLQTGGGVGDTHKQRAIDRRCCQQSPPAGVAIDGVAVSGDVASVVALGVRLQHGHQLSGSTNYTFFIF